MAWTPASSSTTVPDPSGRVAALSVSSAYNWSKVFTRIKVTGRVLSSPHPTVEVDMIGSRRTRPRARYGVDGPAQVAVLGLATSGLFVGAVAALVAKRRVGRLLLFAALFEGFRTGTYLYATLRGKLIVWAREVNALDLTGTEKVLDLGCGRGAALLTVARALTTGQIIGLDVWQAKDQSGNTGAATRRNVDAEGLTDRIELVTGDMRALPFEGNRFDLAVSSLALHNVHGSDGRSAALTEALRPSEPCTLC